MTALDFTSRTKFSFSIPDTKPAWISTRCTMQVHITLPTTPAENKIALAVGTFDGVHRGHQLLVENVKREAAAHGLQSAVLTFQDMPYCFFKPDTCPRLLTLMEEKIDAFAATGIDHLFIVPFNAEIARQSYQEFVQ